MRVWLRPTILAVALLVCTACAGPAGTGVGPIAGPLPTADLSPDPVLSKAMTEALLAVRAGDARRAVDGYFDPIVAAYEVRYAAIKEPLYCARTMAEATRYMQDALVHKRSARVVEAGLVVAYVYRARELMILGDPAKAEAGLLRARILAPANTAVLIQLGALYTALKKLPKALEAYQAAVASFDLSPPRERALEAADAFNGLGGAYLALGRLDEAEATYRRCLEVLPGNGLAQLELNEVRRRQADAQAR
ncbi:tetratricopeptide repeat protein [Nitrospirillum iridis]|uniref:Tetratricopeptide (TPR) repeat protein n=1 Tax=Nitrospirillum iridis TaxID=765888 RepID=A0A7X0ED92_9PROT|nr:tetratricopeptide repeat protein [Nitrospirillum iridis]MBB6250094.1 tetratricopeptide (TPR) repeat protein [Nitrospirillum iridis]